MLDTLLSQSTTPVVTERGEGAKKVRIETQAYLEKISTQNDEYAPLVLQENRLKTALKLIDGRLTLYQRNDWVYDQLYEKIGDKLPNARTVAKRQTALVAAMDALAEERKAAEIALQRQKAERYCYLAADWDVEHLVDGQKQPKPLTVDAVLMFSPMLIQLLLDDVEAAVLGDFLEIQRFSGSA